MEKEECGIYSLNLFIDWWKWCGEASWKFEEKAIRSYLTTPFPSIFLFSLRPRLYKYGNPTLRFDRLQTWVRIYRPPAKVSSSMDYVVTQASSIPSSEFSRKIPRPSVSHTMLAGTSKGEDWSGTNTRKVYNYVSKDFDFRKRGWVCESTSI